MKTNDGGPAFPCEYEDVKSPYPRTIVQTGLSVRDWFAGMALQGMISDTIATIGGEPITPENAVELISARSYEYADAMLKERNKENE